MTFYYTGIGSRKTPIHIQKAMISFAEKLVQKGYVLRSGGADGADISFEKGCDNAKGIKEIYLPWKGFNNSKSNLFEIREEAFVLAETIHPAWGKCSDASKKLHARNCCQVLGKSLDSPSSLLICWTEDGKDIGGTRTAIILAKKNNIPVYNLAIKSDLDKITILLNNLK